MMSGISNTYLTKLLTTGSSIRARARSPRGCWTGAGYLLPTSGSVNIPVSCPGHAPAAMIVMAMSQSIIGATPYEVVFLSHMDTVFPKEEAAKQPFAVHDDRAWAPLSVR